MIDEVLQKMTGEELLLLGIRSGEAVRESISTELDRRALLGPPAAARGVQRVTIPVGRWVAGAVTAA